MYPLLLCESERNSILPSNMRSIVQIALHAAKKLHQYRLFNKLHVSRIEDTRSEGLGQEFENICSLGKTAELFNLPFQRLDFGV